MRRATITLPDDLETELESYLATQDAPPSLTALVQAALRRYLEEARPAGRAVDRPYPSGPSDSANDPWEVAEPVAAHGSAGATGPGSGASSPWMPLRGRRLGDLPDLLASLPRLSEEEADSLAEDLASARNELGRAAEAERAERRDPWAD